MLQRMETNSIFQTKVVTAKQVNNDGCHCGFYIEKKNVTEKSNVGSTL